jgi:hypothetical protein
MKESTGSDFVFKITQLFLVCLERILQRYFDLKRAQIDRDHFGLEDVKQDSRTSCCFEIA